ncbi:ATP-binding protein [Actinoallomurus sp. NPDC052308]|uniref:ATP-binding protein n=1 Tax=Actinoallomurus sp. NPDC052308 TaxID=3155530 RepID=UPI003447D8C4
MTRCALPGEVSGVLLADVRLVNTPESASAARRIVKAVTCAWGAAAVADRAELLVCELVANASRHARDRLGTNLRLVVSRDGERLRIEVHDTDPALPRIRHGGLLEENGRGLLLAETLADRLGWQVLARGKSVYVELIAWPAAGLPR